MVRGGGYSRLRIVVDISVNEARYVILPKMVMLLLLSFYMSGWNKRTAFQG